MATYHFTQNEQMKSLTPIAGTVIGDKYYFIEQNSDVLFEYDFVSENCICRGSLCKSYNSSYYLFVAVVERDQKLYFIPFNAEEVACFDIKTNEITRIPVPGAFRLKKQKCQVAIGIGKQIYMIGYGDSSILVLDTETLKWEVIPMHMSQRNLIYAATLRGCEIYMVSAVSDTLFVFDTETRNLLEMDLNSGNEGFVGVLEMNHELLLVPRTGGIFVLYNLDTEEFRSLSTDLPKEFNSFCGSSYRNEIYVIPNPGGRFLKLILQKDPPFCSTEMIPDLSFDWNRFFGWFPIFYHETMIVPLIELGGSIFYNTESNTAKIKTFIPDEIPEKNSFAEVEIESQVNTLENFLHYLLQGESV